MIMVLDTESLNADIKVAIATNPNCREFLDVGEPINDIK